MFETVRAASMWDLQNVRKCDHEQGFKRTPNLDRLYAMCSRFLSLLSKDDKGTAILQTPSADFIYAEQACVLHLWYRLPVAAPEPYCDCDARLGVT